MNITTINLISLYVAASLGTDSFSAQPVTIVRPETIDALRTQEHNRRLQKAWTDPNTFIIQLPPLLKDSFSIKPETDTRFSTGPVKKPTTPLKSNNGLKPSFLSYS